MQCVEIRDAIDAEDDDLTIENELLVPVLQRSLYDPWIPLSPVVATARDQANPTAVAVNEQAEAVVFYLVKPFRS